jgi:geranylgeranyl diphosphate synthase type II
MVKNILTSTDKETLVSDVINGFFERSIDYATRVDPSYRHLWESMYGLIRSGGKRLRPKIVLMAYEAFGGKNTHDLIPIAAAQEMLHFCLLIHDDVIDRDYVRYGTENIAGRYKLAYAAYVNDSNDLAHYAHSAAILGGDLMLAGAYQLISESNLSESDKRVAQGFLSHSIFEVAGGELLDTELSFAPYASGDALKVAKYKTASYSFVSPILTGATLAGINETQTKALNEYAQSLGIAYQLTDDLLGVFGDEEQTGKSVSSDITEGKRTYMTEQALSAMNDDEQEQFNTIFGNIEADLAQLQQVRLLLETSGAKQATIDLAHSYAVQARAAIEAMDLTDEYASEFEKLVVRVTDRSF